jgi:aspartate oxidase
MNAHYTMNEVLHAIVITPLIHYTMGGIEINNQS